ncbi:hypothetical protein D5086_029524 [Populus alba]|uniref:Uncharacterized protein n=2 Tax=Populus alba TaxID=43335 RepID=A0ACC4ATR6_POPAL|nr:hypothetical protein D5086_0000235170 [Populus alba]
MENVLTKTSSSSADSDITRAPPNSHLPPKKEAGGWRSVKYILGNESFEKLASMGLIANLTVYLQTRFNMDGIQLVNVFNIWSGSTNVTPLLGAFFILIHILGRFRTLICGSTRLSGHGRHVPNCRHSKLKTPPLHWRIQLPKTRVLAAWSPVFGLDCFAIGAGGYAYRSLLVLLYCHFLDWKTHYIISKAAKEAFFVDMAKVIVAACKKRALSLESTPENSFYDPPCIESDQQVTKLAHTNMFKFFDKACPKLLIPSELDDKGLVPVWITGIGCFITMDQMNTFGLMQAIQFQQQKSTNFKIPPGWMGLSSMICLSTWIFVYEQIYLPYAKKRSKKNVRLTMRQRINTGIVMAYPVAMVVAGIVEKNRREKALKQGSLLSPQSILLLLPQFSLSGLNEGFAAVAVMEYYTNHLPESMRTLAGAIFFLSFSASSYLNTAIVNVVHQVTAKLGKTPWLGGRDLNKVKLDNFYYLIAGLALLNLLYFNLFSCRYLVKNADKTPGSRHEDKGLEMNENV